MAVAKRQRKEKPVKREENSRTGVRTSGEKKTSFLVSPIYKGRLRGKRQKI